jgi:hypothetical protein
MFRSLASLSVAAFVLVTGTAAANPDKLPAQLHDPRPSTQGQGDEAVADFGTGFFYQGIDGSQFDPRLSTTPYERGSATGTYYCATGGVPSSGRGQIFVPHGVRLNSTRVWIYDGLATHSVSVTAQSVCQPDFAAGNPVVTDLTTVSSTAAFNGGDFSGFDNGALGTITDNQSCTYRFEVSFPQGCAGLIDLGVQKARLSWQRFTPVAPVVATFTDVPTNAQFFREIEALANTGVTGGCTATQFCPDATVTRRQMAAFLARALGLPGETIVDPANP